MMTFAPRLPRHRTSRARAGTYRNPKTKSRARTTKPRCEDNQNSRQNRTAAPTRNPKKNLADPANFQKTPVTFSDDSPKSRRVSIQAARCNTTTKLTRRRKPERRSQG